MTKSKWAATPSPKRPAAPRSALYRSHDVPLNMQFSYRSQNDVATRRVWKCEPNKEPNKSRAMSLVSAGTYTQHCEVTQSPKDSHVALQGNNTNRQFTGVAGCHCTVQRYNYQRVLHSLSNSHTEGHVKRLDMCQQSVLIYAHLCRNTQQMDRDNIVVTLPFLLLASS
jgi:hypothetical protein